MSRPPLHQSGRCATVADTTTVTSAPAPAATPAPAPAADALSGGSEVHPLPRTAPEVQAAPAPTPVPLPRNASYGGQLARYVAKWRCALRRWLDAASFAFLKRRFGFDSSARTVSRSGPRISTFMRKAILICILVVPVGWRLFFFGAAVPTIGSLLTFSKRRGASVGESESCTRRIGGCGLPVSSLHRAGFQFFSDRASREG